MKRVQGREERGSVECVWRERGRESHYGGDVGYRR